MLTSTLPRLKPFIAFGISALCLWALWHNVSDVSWVELSSALLTISIGQWAIALAATAVSFWAVGYYDVVWHRHIGTGVSPAKAHRTGMATVAIAQTVGMGNVTGSFLRWHLLQGVSFRLSAALSIAIALSFFGCWAVLAVLAASWLSFVPLALILCTVTGAAVVVRVVPKPAWLARHTGLIPRLMLWSFVDVVFAAVALWALLPEGTSVGYGTICAAFTLALGAGLISNAPGGLGAFDLALLALLPAVPEATLLATILAFRVVYYVVPALLGAAVLLASHLRSAEAITPTNEHPISDLCHQGATLHRDRHGTQVRRCHLLGAVSLEPCTWDFKNAMHPFGFQALYKCSPALAAEARRQGWAVRRIASDAIIRPQTWSTHGAKRSQLRRKLRQAEKAGVTITRAGLDKPEAAMNEIANSWARHHGGELGYSMGRYDPAYVAQQSTYLIHHGDILCGFMTVQTRTKAWAVDLIRHTAAMPNGAMHAAVTRIIADASVVGVETLSLGAVPAGPEDSPLQTAILANKAGLRQFKSAFDPRWSPRYLAAPTKAQWVLSLALITWHTQRPISRWSTRLTYPLTKLIKMERIIHLIHNKESDITPLNETTSGAPADDQPTFETARRA